MHGTDLRTLKLARYYGATRLVLVDHEDTHLIEARRIADAQPAVAVFALIDHLVDRLDLPDDRRGELLASVARAALKERAIAATGSLT